MPRATHGRPRDREFCYHDGNVLANKQGRWLTLGGCLMQVVERKLLRGYGIVAEQEKLGMHVARNEARYAYSNERKGGKSSIE